MQYGKAASTVSFTDKCFRVTSEKLERKTVTHAN